MCVVSEQDSKFGRLEGNSREIPHVYPDSWAMERTGDQDRLVITQAVHQVKLVRDLSQVMHEPFGILYVLVVPRGAHEAGRYQSPTPVSRQDLLNFLNRFEHFLESDGRHILWVASIGEPDLLVYDRHNMIYSYGRLEHFKKILETKAIAETPQVKIPSPHVHYYHEEFDENENQLLRYWDWKRSPLRNQDTQ
jgi:hypothetical protein